MIVMSYQSDDVIKILNWIERHWWVLFLFPLIKVYNKHGMALYKDVVALVQLLNVWD